ncbi:hypothetical protein M9Y10_023676 [Tritrichomonas musculus]|uniref:Surface antigen BspA-like n=1 Tax=Tritrichomonas musculus TaxID=1915356 RepID=A0ABR2KVU8_9EUKA
MKLKTKESQEIEPPEPNFIENARNITLPISESDFNDMIIIDKSFFSKIDSYYIYEINFSKESKLMHINNGSFSSLHLYSITLPPSLQILMPESLKGCFNLREINFLESHLNRLKIICDEAFIDTKIISIVLPESITELGSNCFPNCLNQVEFEKGAPKLEKIGDKAFSQTKIEIFNFPSNILPFVKAKNCFLRCNQLHKVVFDFYADKNKQFENYLEKEETEEIEKRLNKKRNFKEKIISDEKVSETDDNISKMSQDLAKSYLLSQIDLKSIDVFASNLNHFHFFNTPNLNVITISKSDNSKYHKVDGLLYTKDMKKLIVAERNIKEAVINSKCHVITNYALNVKSLEKVVFEKNSELHEISFFAFSESNIKDIVIPDTVDLIDYCAFYKCKNLETLNIPISMHIVDFFTFSYTKITKITIPKNIVKIKYGCFFRCENLKTVLFEEHSNLFEIDDYAFSLTKIESISIPSKVKRIGNCCFYNCHELKSIKFENDSNISIIGFKCFEGTKIDEKQLNQIIQKVDFSQTKTRSHLCFGFDQKIEKVSCFMNPLILANITEIFIPSKIEEICFHSFFNCSSLTKVKIIDIENSKLKTISEGAFYNCDSLIEFEIPKTVNYFGQFCFKNCSNFEAKISIISDKKVVICKSAFEKSGVTDFKLQSERVEIDDFAFQNCQKLTEFSFERVNVIDLRKSVFSNCSSLNIVDIPLDVEEIAIGESCFMKSSIKSFVVPNNLKIIPKGCFKLCQNLNEVIIDMDSSNLELFGEKAFSGAGIEVIIIPHHTMIIEKSCFKKCKKLKQINFSEALQGVVINEKAFYMAGLESLYLPRGIKRFKYGCFENCTNLKSVVFNLYAKLKKIEENVFKSTGIEHLAIGSNVKFISKYSFQNCENLQTISFTGNDVTIQALAFLGCKNLNKIDCHSKITIIPMDSKYHLSNNYLIKITKDQIKNDAVKTLLLENEPIIQMPLFCNFRNYTQINEKFNIDSNFDLKVRNLKDGNIDIKTVEHLEGCYYTNHREKIIFCDFLIESIIIPKETTVIKSNAFRYSCLKKIDFEVGSKLEKIKKKAFKNLQIEEISIPNSVTIIDDFAFSNCCLLKKVNIAETSHLYSIGKSAFEKTSIESFLFPPTLRIVDDCAFYECDKLRTIKNCSNQIKFGWKSFYHSAIENIKFPSKSTFSNSSFLGCLNLKSIKFRKKIEKVVFEENSFSFSGLESLKIENSVEIHETAFSFCSNLKKITLSGENNQCSKSSFNHSNIESFILVKEIDTPEYLEYFYLNIKDTMKLSSIKQILLNLTINNNTHNFYLNHNCYVFDNELFFANLIDNVNLFKNEPCDEIKENEILVVSGNVKKLNFPVMSHIKKIQWSPNCIVEDLGPPGFFSYYNLVEIVIPKLVSKIPPHLFENCHYLRTVHFDKGTKLTEIGEFAFANTLIYRIKIPSTVKVIRQSTFAYNPNLSRIIFDGEIIEKDAFLQTGLTKFTLSNNTKIIEEGAFQYCRSLKKFDIDIENSMLYEIGPYAFSETSITEINIPREIETINKFVFNGCQKLKEVKIAQNSKLQRIEDFSFSGTLSLKKINLPKTVTSLSYKAFINTPSLVSIMSESNQYFTVMENQAVFSKKDRNLIFVPRNLKKFKVPKNCAIIHSGAFCGPNLESVQFSDNSLICIEECGFAHSIKLNAISIPNSIQKIENEAFIDCQNLEVVDFMSPCQLKVIPKFCFAFSGLKTIKLPSTIEIINHSSFYYCQNLQNINLSELNLRFIGDSAFCGTNIQEIKFPSTIQFIDNHSFESTKSLEFVDFSRCKNIQNWEIPSKRMRFIRYINKIKSAINQSESNSNCYIHETSFYNSSVKILKFKMDEFKWFHFCNKCNKIEEYIVNDDSRLYLKKLPIGNSYEIEKVDWINHETFIPFRYLNTSKLIKITFGNDIKLSKIPNCCFAFSCLEEISLPDSLKAIKSAAFKDCYNLENVTFSPNSKLKKIERFAFYNCRKLKSFSIPNQVKIISVKSFSFCGLTEIEIPESVEKIEYMAFYNCKELKNVILNEGLKGIGKYSFANCYLINKIDLPNSVKSIESYSFLNCVNLKQFNTMDKTQLIELRKGAFENTKIEKLKLNPSLEIQIEPQCASYLTEISFYEGELLFFNQFDDGVLYFKDEYANKVVFVPSNLEYLKIRKAWGFYPIVLKEVKNLTTIELPNERDFNGIEFSSTNKIKKIIVSSQCEEGFDRGFYFKYKNYLLDYLEKVEFDEMASIDIICSESFISCKKLTKIVIPFTCHAIGHKAFKDCINLKTVEFGTVNESTTKIKDKLESIGSEAFCNCSSLTSILIPPTIQEILKGAFMNCINLKHVNFGFRIFKSGTKQIINYYSFNCNNFVLIQANAFRNCSSLESFRIPSSCQNVGECAFMNCTSLRSIKFKGKDMFTIRPRTFYNCSSLTSFEYHGYCGSNFHIGHEAFMNCSSLTDIIIENMIKSKLKSLPNRLPCLDIRAFCSCSSLKIARFFIGNLMEISEKAFMNCTSLESIEIGSNYNSIIFNSTAYIGVPKDLKVKLFIKQKDIRVFQPLKEEKQADRNEKITLK